MQKITAVIFPLTAFVGSFLLFLIQPLIAKQILPIFGGGQYVWMAAMICFQALLLLGYAYAHFLLKLMDAKFAAAIHLVLLAISTILLPIIIDKSFDVGASKDEVLSVIIIIMVAVGAQFFLLSANVPSLQSWLNLTRQKKNNYYLFIASNLGSFAGLISFPIIIEPLFESSQQVELWTYIYFAYICLVAISAFSLIKIKTLARKEKITLITKNKNKLMWLVLAFIPSSLMLGLTSHMSNDVITVPLLWIIPLAVYLLSFTVAFSKYGEKMFANLQQGALNLLILIIILTLFNPVFLPIFILHILCFFALATICHHRLYIFRPNEKGMTKFYLWLALGGVLGGVFNAVIAPKIFNGIYEYFLMLIAAILVLKNYQGESKDALTRGRIILLITLFVTLILLFIFSTNLSFEPIRKKIAELVKGGDKKLVNQIITALIFINAVFLCQYARANKYILITALLAIFLIASASINHYAYVKRNYYGVVKIFHDEDSNNNIFMHSTTVHGFQIQDKEKRLEPTGYHRWLKDIFRVAEQRLGKQDVGVLGLGVGTVACLAKKDQKVVFYEIDEDVIAIATNENYFTFISHCPAKSSIVLGDGRLKIATHQGKFGIILADAFSSDSIPTHLMTIEALRIYETKLLKDGIIAFNISSRFLDLRQVLAAAAREVGFNAYMVEHNAENSYELNSHWVVMTKSEKGIEKFIANKKWHRLEPGSSKAWTDSYSGILSVIR